ncbi:hypothetical protein ACQUQU_15500 [Thalassolituus sp. LLYu03]
MNKPDILILLTVVVLIGAAVTTLTSEPARPAALMTMENSIR